MATEHITLGNALITIHHPTFFEGYTSGFRHYRRSDYQQPLTDTAIQHLLERPFTEHCEMWRAGFLMGWLTAIHGLPRLQHSCKIARYRGQQQRQHSTAQHTRRNKQMTSPSPIGKHHHSA
ncbi:MAG TPA: hypothetical protein VH593_10745 [Ktedonobacteraceae bacterium]